MLPILILFAQSVLLCSCEIKIEAIGTNSTKTNIGESPVYVPETNSVYYVDVKSNEQLLRYDLSKNKIYKAHIKGVNGPAGFILPIADRKNKFAFSNGNKIAIVRWDGEEPEAEALGTQFVLDADTPTHFIHGGFADPSGNLFAETLRGVLCNPNSTEPAGGLSRSNDGQTVKRVVSGMNSPNGFAFDEIRKVLYLVETCTKQIRAYDWDPLTSGISNERIVIDLKAYTDDNPNHAPDGLVLDTDGNIYVAMNGLGSIYKIDPTTSTISQKIQIPDLQYIQTLTFGGKNLDILFVTTTAAPFDVTTRKPLEGIILSNNAGLLHKITGLGVKGRPAKKLPKKFATSAPEKSLKSKFRKLFD